MSPLAKSVVGRVILYFVALLIVMVLWALCGEARAQTPTADSVVVFYRCEPRKPPTKAQLDSLVEWAKKVFVEGGKFKIFGFASTRDHDKRDEAFARNRKEAGKKILVSAGFVVKDGGVFGGPGFYRGLKVVFLRPTVDTTARRTAMSAISKADLAVSHLAKKTTDTFLELGGSYIFTSETQNVVIPSVGLIFQYRKLEVGIRGGGLPKIYSNTNQRLFHGEFIAGVDFGLVGIAGKLGGVVITPKNVTTRDVMTLYGGPEVKTKLYGKLFAKGAYILTSTRKYRSELHRFKTDNKLRGRFTLTISAEL